ncbi:hypothetical protein KSP39_PZI017636 [Platanthera zijinensis]|uniref:Uncharacterized protein n=1 Tax=Platanthera zijinensis TaxID=2320716 RepID=A0AAP0B4I5_9ASPA
MDLVKIGGGKQVRRRCFVNPNFLTKQARSSNDLSRIKRLNRFGRENKSRSTNQKTRDLERDAYIVDAIPNRTVRVTAAVYWGFHSKQLTLLLPTFQHRAGVRLYTSCYHLTESCVFKKQSLPPAAQLARLGRLNQALRLPYLVSFLSSQMGIFASWLRISSPSLLSQYSTFSSPSFVAQLCSSLYSLCSFAYRFSGTKDCSLSQ